MSRRSAAWLAWAVCALSLALTALSFFLMALILRLDTPLYFFWLSLTITAIGYSVIGAVIASPPPQPTHRLDLLRDRLYRGGGPLRWRVRRLRRAGALRGASGCQAMLWLQSWLWMLFVGLLVFLLLLFPTGRLPSSRWRPFAWVSVAMISVAVIWSSIISPDVRPDAPPSPVQLSVMLLGLVAAASVVVGRRGARGGRVEATADQVAAVRRSDILCRSDLPNHRLLRCAGRGGLGFVGWQYPWGS